MAEANARIARVDAWLIPGLGRTIAITNANGTDWPADTFVHFGPLSASTGEVVPTIAAITATVVGAVATVTLTEANVAAIRTAYPSSGVARCPWHIRTGSGAGEVAQATGFLGWDLTGSAQSATAVATVVVGPQGLSVAAADVVDGELIITLDSGDALPPVGIPALILTPSGPGLYAMAGDVFTEDEPGLWSLGGAIFAEVDGATKALPAAVVTGNQGTTSGTFASGNHAHAGVYDPAGTVSAHASAAGAHSIAGVSGLQAALDGKAATLGADDNYATDAEKVKLANLSGTNTGDQTLPTWGTIASKPAVVAEGATQALARTAIGLGNAAVKDTGTAAGTVATGDHNHSGVYLTTETLPATLMDAKGDIVSATADNTPARLAVGASGGSLVADSTQATGLRWMTALRLEGSGSPEGVKTALIGSTYTDSAATNGAALWVKASGASNTGWVAHGDTGWRNVRADIEAGWTCDGTGSYHLYIRRIGNTVQLQGKAQAATTSARSTSIPIYVAPAGFRGVQFPARGTVSPVTGSTIGVGVLRSVASAQSIEVFFPAAGNWTVGDIIYFQGSWATAEAWPSTLPGSAV